MLSILVLIIVGGSACNGKAAGKENFMGKKVFSSTIAGSWYTADEKELKKEISSYLVQAGEKTLKGVHALIQPHAGYMYSGPAAAFGIKQIAGESFSRVVVLGPSHRYYIENAACLPDATHFATPLGELPLDLEFMARLKKSPLFITRMDAHTNEHSVQIQLPLLQAGLGAFRLVPVVVGQLDLETARSMAEVFLSLIDAETLVVVSSDFCHYGSNFNYLPFKKNIEENLRKLDQEAFDWIAKKDAAGFYDYLDRTGATICGKYPISILLSMLGNDNHASPLQYNTSGKMTGDFTNSVSYFSIAFNGQWRAVKTAEERVIGGYALSARAKADLLKLARSTMEAHINKQQTPHPSGPGIEITDEMQQIMGGFVTLKMDGELRGCIGEINPRRPLYQVVQDYAVTSAVRDPRFLPVTPAELDKITMEISALTPPVAVDSYHDIVVGKHGIVLSRNGHSAVFLPQVAPEQGWGLAETLSHLSIKAGLPPDGWKEGAAFKVFEAIVFGEEDDG